MGSNLHSGKSKVCPNCRNGNYSHLGKHGGIFKCVRCNETFKFPLYVDPITAWRERHPGKVPLVPATIEKL